jgi:hypothetical protein
MSRAYRIAVSESVSRTIHVEDGVATSLELLDILPPERMGGILTDELKRRGYEVDGDTATKTDDDGVEITIDIKSGQVTARVSADKDVEVKRERVFNVEISEKDSARKRLSEQVKRELESDVEVRKNRLREEVTKKLEGALGELRGELDQISRGVTAVALKERAAQLGEIKEITEDPKTGSMTIKVRV